jgi:hypothetical protein
MKEGRASGLVDDLNTFIQLNPTLNINKRQDRGSKINSIWVACIATSKRRRLEENVSSERESNNNENTLVETGQIDVPPTLEQTSSNNVKEVETSKAKRKRLSRRKVTNLILHVLERLSRSGYFTPFRSQERSFILVVTLVFR